MGGEVVNDPIRLDTTSLCSTDDVARIHQSNEQQSLTHSYLCLWSVFSNSTGIYASTPNWVVAENARYSPNLLFLFSPDSFFCIRFHWIPAIMLVEVPCVTSRPVPLKLSTRTTPCSFPLTGWMWIRIKANEMVEGTLKWPCGRVLTAFWKCLNTRPGRLIEQEINFYCFEHHMFRSICYSN